MNRVRTRPVEQTITVDTPMGPIDFTYGGLARYGSDYLTGKYRGKDVQESNRKAVVRAIEKIEAEHQTKQARDAKRKDLVKNPIPAIRLVVGGWTIQSRRTGAMRKSRTSYSGQSPATEQVLVFQPTVLEDVQVRGEDLRTSGQALIVRENGDKDQIAMEQAIDRWGRTTFVAIGKPILLGDLEDHERADVVALCRAVERESADRPILTGADDAIEAAYDDEEFGAVEVTYDPDTDERVATFRGRVIRKQTASHIERYIYRVLLHEAGWTIEAPEGASILEPRGPGTPSMVCRDQAEFEAWAEHEDRITDALTALGDGIADLRFDASLVALPADDPEPEPDDTDTDVPRVTAPDRDGDEW